MVQAAFDKLLGQIGVSAAQRSQGSISQQHVRSLLDGKRSRDPSFPWLADGDFLSGSYARGTKIHPLDDIDVMVVLDGTGLRAYDEGVLQDAEVRGHGRTGSPVEDYTGPDGMISSRRILQAFRDALAESYPNSTIQKNGQAVNVWLDSYGLGLDIVPSFHIIPRDGSTERYFIPQGGDEHGWMKTNPKKDEEVCDMLDARHNKKFKQVVRLLKHWNRVHNADRLTSYHVETLAFYIFSGYPEVIVSHAQALRYFFERAPGHLGIPCPDATSLGGPVDAYLSNDDRRLTITKLGEATAAFRVDSLPLLPAAELPAWRKIFGPSFGT